ncbi:MAG: zf-HC2 domain-containing protein [Bryobacteraceae bacterium]|jgi:Predicted integral membrane protein|nr:zf-HC2 domain-containing protein [Bryobacteraceae bacterium]
MHQPIKDGLEEYLSGEADGSALQQFHAHLRECEPCRKEVELLYEQKLLFRSLRPPRPVAPAPGFYARVMERIEAQQMRPSFWSDLLEPVFARRLMYSSAILLVLLGTYMWSTESNSPFYNPGPEAILASDDSSESFGVDLERDREKILVRLTTYSE